MEKQNWANIESEDEDYDEQEHQQSQYQESQEQTTEQQTTEARPPGFGQGQRENRGQYGNRGPRGSGRGGRGRGGNSRGGRQEGQRKPPRENQPEEEMMNVVKRSQDKTVFINLFNVEYNAEEEDIKTFYNDVKIVNINRLGQGLFLVELDKNEAMKMIELGTGDIHGRRFFMKMGYSNKQQNPDDQWHHVNSGNHQRDLARHQDKEKRGGYGKPYNRREQGDYQNDGGFKKSYDKPFRKPRDDAPKEDEPIDTNNKFFKGHDLNNTEFKPRFINSKAKQTEGGATTAQTGESGDSQPKVNKPNPFGAAVPRDETEYLKKKEEEKGQVQDLKENFEEKKEEVATDTNISPSNTPDIEADKSKSQGPPGFSKKTFTNKNKPEVKSSAPQTKTPTIVQKGQQPTAGDKEKKAGGANKKTNIFDLLNE